MAEAAMRDAYGDGLLEIGEEERIVVLDADLAKATSSVKFKQRFPERFFDMGIAEQNMFGTAAGMASCGYRPYVSTFAMFAVGRAYEQIRNAVCYSKLPVNIVATHAGLSPNADGGSHQTVEDIGLMRELPGMTVLSPCDYGQAKEMIVQMKDLEGPAYIRLSRHPVPAVEHGPTKIGVVQVVREGGDICIAATGIMVAMALEAANMLAERGVEATVLNVHTIKPLDEEGLIRYATGKKVVITAEEHSVIGGLGAAVSQALSSVGGIRVESIGIRDRFGQSGDLEELLKTYGLTADNIVEKAFIHCR